MKKQSNHLPVPEENEEELFVKERYLPSDIAHCTERYYSGSHFRILQFYKTDAKGLKDLSQIILFEYFLMLGEAFTSERQSQFFHSIQRICFETKLKKDKVAATIEHFEQNLKILKTKTGGQNNITFYTINYLKVMVLIRKSMITKEEANQLARNPTFSNSLVLKRLKEQRIRYCIDKWKELRGKKKPKLI